MTWKQTRLSNPFRRRRIISACLLGFLTILVFSLYAIGQTTQPFEDEPLKSGAAQVHPAAASTASVPATAGGLDITRVLLALLVVLLAIFLLRWTARQFVRVGIPEGKPIKVLSRSTLSARQQLLLLQVGKRLVVVGDSGGAMNPLCEIDDPDEVAMLIGQAGESHPMTKSFGKIFRRASDPFDDAASPPQTPGPPAEEPPSNHQVSEMSRDIGGLIEKVQLMRNQFKKS